MKSSSLIFSNTRPSKVVGRPRKRLADSDLVDITADPAGQLQYYPEVGSERYFREFLYPVSEMGLPQERVLGEPTAPALIPNIPVGLYTSIYWTLVGVEVFYILNFDGERVERYYRAFAAQEPWRRRELIPFIHYEEKDEETGRYGLFLEIGAPSAQGERMLGLHGTFFDEGPDRAWRLTHRNLPSNGLKTTFNAPFMGFTFPVHLMSNRFNHIEVECLFIKPLFARI